MRRGLATSGGGFRYTVCGLLALLPLAGCVHRLPNATPGAPSGVLAVPPDYETVGPRRFSIEATIVAVDGRDTRFFREAELSLSPGCHLVEVEFDHTIDMSERPSVCLAFAPAGECRELSEHTSWSANFAILVEDGKRYELASLVQDEVLWAYFVEVDPNHGTLARFPPVYPGTTTCRPGIPVGQTPGFPPREG